jgi:hypothetical protein
MFHKLKFIEQCNLSSPSFNGLEGGGGDGLDSEVNLFILDSRQLEAAVGSNDLLEVLM